MAKSLKKTLLFFQIILPSIILPIFNTELLEQDTSDFSRSFSIPKGLEGPKQHSESGEKYNILYQYFYLPTTCINYTNFS